MFIISPYPTSGPLRVTTGEAFRLNLLDTSGPVTGATYSVQITSSECPTTQTFEEMTPYACTPEIALYYVDIILESEGWYDICVLREFDGVRTMVPGSWRSLRAIGEGGSSE